MRKPFIVSVSGISGGGKTTVITELHKRLSGATVLRFDDYGDDVYLERNINDWSANGYDCDEWHTEPIVRDIKRLLKEPYDYIILDYPFGYLNSNVGKHINMAVYIDTPLDVALARRIIRDYTSRSQENDFGLADVEDVSLKALDKELRCYLSQSRPTYARMPEILIPVSDLVVDGMKSANEIVDELISFIVSKKSFEPGK